LGLAGGARWLVCSRGRRIFKTTSPRDNARVACSDVVGWAADRTHELRVLVLRYLYVEGDHAAERRRMPAVAAGAACLMEVKSSLRPARKLPGLLVSMQRAVLVMVYALKTRIASIMPRIVPYGMWRRAALGGSVPGCDRLHFDYCPKVQSPLCAVIQRPAGRGAASR